MSENNLYVIGDLDQQNIYVRMFLWAAFFISICLFCELGELIIPVLTVSYLLFKYVRKIIGEHSINKFFYWYLGIKPKKLKILPDSNLRIFLG